MITASALRIAAAIAATAGGSPASAMSSLTVGSTVNIAQRLEELTKSLDHDCIVSAWAVRAARAERSGGWTCRGLPAQSIRGHSEPVGIFALTTGRDAGRSAARGGGRP